MNVLQLMFQGDSGMSEGAEGKALNEKAEPRDMTEEQVQVEQLQQEAVDLRDALEKQMAQTREYLDAARRITAEFDNYRKRSAKDREEIIRAANDKLIAELLTVHDDMERALASNASAEEFRRGVNQIHLNLEALLKSYGLREIPANDKFDPSLHEALSIGEGEEGKILEVYQKGYCLGPRVLRHSKVKVGVKPETTNSE
jgi:molecular chaperone GrpE